MKKLLLLLTIPVFLLSSCSDSDQNTMKNIAIVDGYVFAVQKLDYNLMDNFLADNYKGYGPSANDSIGKAEATAAWKKNVDELYEKIEYKKSRSIAVTVPEGENQGDWVSNWSQVEITYKEGGKKVTIWANTVYKIEEDQISKSYTFYNEADVLEQLGYIFINPENL